MAKPFHRRLFLKLFLVGLVLVGIGGYSIYHRWDDQFPVHRLPEWSIFTPLKVERTRSNIHKLESAIALYRNHYGKLPFTSPERELQFSITLGHELNGVAATYNRINPDGLKFLPLRAGQQKDGWGNRYSVFLDHNGDGFVSPSGIPVNKQIGIWSNGPNRIDERGGGDDIRNW